MWRLLVLPELLTCIFFHMSSDFHKQFNSTPLLEEPPEVLFSEVEESISQTPSIRIQGRLGLSLTSVTISSWNSPSKILFYQNKSLPLVLLYKIERWYYALLLVSSWHVLCCVSTSDRNRSGFIGKISQCLALSWRLQFITSVFHYISLCGKRKENVE